MNEDDILELNYRKPTKFSPAKLGMKVATLWADKTQIGIVTKVYRDNDGAERVKVKYKEQQICIMTVDYYLCEWMNNIKKGKIKII